MEATTATDRPRQAPGEATDAALAQARETLARMDAVIAAGDGRAQFLVQLGVGMFGGAVALLSAYRFASQASFDVPFVALLTLGFGCNLVGLAVILHAVLSFNRRWAKEIDVDDLRGKLYAENWTALQVKEMLLKDHVELVRQRQAQNSAESRLRRVGLWLLVAAFLFLGAAFLMSAFGAPAPASTGTP